MKTLKRWGILTLCALLLTGLLTVPALAESAVPAAGKAMIGETQYDTLAEAIAAAQDGDTIVLGEGLYTTYKAASPKKSLTFVGQGADKTHWGIGATIPDPANFGTEYNGDYSFDGCTFHSSGKTINVYTDYGAGKNDITVNFKNCTVVSEKDGKKTGHAIDTANDKHTDGCEDDAFDVTETMPWTEQADGSFLRKVRKVCQYCGFSEEAEERKQPEPTPSYTEPEAYPDYSETSAPTPTPVPTPVPAPDSDVAPKTGGNDGAAWVLALLAAGTAAFAMRKRARG